MNSMIRYFMVIHYVLHILWAEHVFEIQIISQNKNTAIKEDQMHFEPFSNTTHCLTSDEEKVNTEDDD